MTVLRHSMSFLLMIATTCSALDLDNFDLEEPEEEPKPRRETQKAEARKKVSKPSERDERLRNVKHPRLLITPERLALIRKKIKEPGSHWQLAHADMVERSGRDPKEIWGGDFRSGYWPVYASLEAAFLSLIGEDPAERRQYAALAANHLPSLDYVQWYGFKSKSLGHAMATFGTALTYDWAYNEWTDAERLGCENLLKYFEEHWQTYRRVSETDVTSYNFYGVLYGAQSMLHLAMGAEKTNPRFPVCVDILAKHLAACGGELGANGEGMGYTEYPMGFALSSALALAQHGQPEPLRAAKRHEFWKLNMYVQTFMGPKRKFVQYGVAHCSNPNEGLASLLLRLCPEEQLPYYLWFYDRHMGVLSKMPANDRFDSHRGRSGFGMICYPDGIAARDPTGVYPPMVHDSHGYWFFRNRWKDENDIHVAIMADLAKGHGWGQPEQLSIRLMAFNTSFIGGPGKERGPDNYSTLLVDGEYGVLEKGAHKAGKVVASECGKDGGYVIVDAGTLYEKLGVQRAQRHLLVSLSDPDRNTAVLSTLDEIDADTEHAYTWQANLGPEGVIKPPAPPRKKAAKPKAPVVPRLSERNVFDSESDDGLVIDIPAGKAEKPKPPPPPPEPKPRDDDVESECGTEAGRPYFLLTGRNGHVKGWVLHPAEAKIKTGDPLQITTHAAGMKIWVVMHAAPGKAPPTATIEGQGMQSVLKLGSKTVRFDGKRIELVAGSGAQSGE